MLRQRRLAALPVLFLFFLFLGGCAFGTRNPTLIYPPQTESSTPATAHAALQQPDKQVEVVLKPFADERSDKRTVGTVRNTFGMKTADVVPINDVAVWVTEAVRFELRSNGYTVVDRVKAGSQPVARLTVSGEVLNVYCDMYMSYSGQVALHITATGEKQAVLDRTYSGEGSAGLAWAATADSYAQSLALSLNSALKQFVADLNRSVATQP